MENHGKYWLDLCLFPCQGYALCPFLAKFLTHHDGGPKKAWLFRGCDFSQVWLEAGLTVYEGNQEVSDQSICNVNDGKGHLPPPPPNKEIQQYSTTSMTSFLSFPFPPSPDTSSAKLQCIHPPYYSSKVVCWRALVKSCAQDVMPMSNMGMTTHPSS